MKYDSESQRDVENAILREPFLQAPARVITAQEDVVTLTGVVNRYAKKNGTEMAAKSVISIKNLVENLEVESTNSWIKANGEKARDLLNVLKSNGSVPEDKVTVLAATGSVVLAGELPRNYQPVAIESAVRDSIEAIGVTNNILIKPDAHDAIEQHQIEKVMAKSGLVDVASLKVEMSGTIVTLSGTVDSWYKKEEAAWIAWKTPGISHVKNEWVIDYQQVTIEKI